MTLFTEARPPGNGLALASVEDLSLSRAKVLWATATGKVPTTHLGLVQIVPPRYKDNLLCMASVAIKADSSDDDSKANINAYNQLKRRLKQSFTRGVWGVNSKYGGEHFYKDIFISEGAISEFLRRRELGPEGGDGFVRFEFRRGNSGSA